jgi:hypothetical protein
LFADAPQFEYNDTRNYLFIVESAVPNGRLFNTQAINLGVLDISWRSYMGESGSSKIGPFKNEVIVTPKDRI